MLKHRIVLPMCLVAAVAIGLWTTQSDGQEAQIVPHPVPGRVALGLAAPHGEFSLFVAGPGEGGEDDETRQLRQRDHEQEQATRQLLDQYRGAESAGDRSDILEKLSAAVRDQFEVRQQIREKELEALEVRVRKLRELHEKRQDARAEIVEQRVEQLVREAEGLGWGSGGGPHEMLYSEAGANSVLWAPSTPQRGAIRVEARPSIEVRPPTLRREPGDSDVDGEG
jgi:hypothetical protein